MIKSIILNTPLCSLSPPEIITCASHQTVSHLTSSVRLRARAMMGVTQLNVSRDSKLPGWTTLRSCGCLGMSELEVKHQTAMNILFKDDHTLLIVT